MMYGREPLIPWQMENDLRPLDMSQEVPDFTTEETIDENEESLPTSSRGGSW